MLLTQKRNARQNDIKHARCVGRGGEVEEVTVQKLHQNVRVEQLSTGETNPYDFARWMRKNPGQMQNRHGCPAMQNPIGCSGNICHAAMMHKAGQLEVTPGMDERKETVLAEAHDFFVQFFAGDEAKVSERMLAVQEEVQESGTYWHTPEELQFGARRAWRNAGRCIYRQAAETLILRDCRQVTSADGMFEQLCQHARQAWEGKDNVPLISIFPPKQPGSAIDMEFISPQPWRFAAYEDGQGGIVGDPGNLQLTKYCVKLGWVPPPLEERTEWDLLPVVLRTDTAGVKMYELPKDLKEMVVHISHPDKDQRRAFQDLSLRWNGLPILNTFTLWCGGVAYPCAPFSGWFMVTEVARNFADKQRYNKLGAIASALDLDDGDDFSPDTAFLHLHKAILHSWSKVGAPMVSHRAASEGFCLWYRREMEKTGAVPGDWAWLVPPLGGSTLSVFHQEMLNYQQLPLYIPNPDRLSAQDLSKIQVVAKPLWEIQKALKGQTVLILIGSQTGNTELKARSLARHLKTLGAGVTMANMDEARAFETSSNSTLADEAFKNISCDSGSSDSDSTCESRESPQPPTGYVEDAKRVYTLLEDAASHATIVLCLTSTFGSGAPPQSASIFLPSAEFLSELAAKQPRFTVQHLRYTVCGFGNSNFPHFNRTGRVLQEALEAVAGPPLVKAGEVDEKRNSQAEFLGWFHSLMGALGVSAADSRLDPVEEEMPEWEWVGHIAALQKGLGWGSEGSTKRRTSLGRLRKMPSTLRLIPKLNSSRLSRTALSSHLCSLLCSSARCDTPTQLSAYHMEVLENSELIAPGSSSMRHLVLRSEGGTIHRAGDTIEVIAENSAEEVEEFATAVGLAPGLLRLSFRLKYPEDRVGKHSEPTNLHRALTKDIDIKAPPAPEFLRHLVRALGEARPADPNLQQLRELQDGGPAYQKWVMAACPTVPSLLKDVNAKVEFPLPKGQPTDVDGPPKNPSAIMLSAAALIGSLPMIRPRHFSISNGSASTKKLMGSDADLRSWCAQYIGQPSRLNLTVSVNQIQGSQAGPGSCTDLRSGLTSGYISRLQKGDVIHARIIAQPTNRLPAPEKLKEFGTKAVLLMGIGSGIAPLRAVLQELMYYRVRYGLKTEVMLIHGCRTEEERVYLSEFQDLTQMGILEVKHALSRSKNTAENCYVQDVVRQEQAKILKMLMQQRALVYICGATAAVQSIRSTLLDAVLCSAGCMDQDKAKEVLEKMVADGLFHEDAFGG